MTNETPRYDTDDDSVVEADVDNASVQTDDVNVGSNELFVSGNRTFRPSWGPIQTRTFTTTSQTYTDDPTWWQYNITWDDYFSSGETITLYVSIRRIADPMDVRLQNISDGVTVFEDTGSSANLSQAISLSPSTPGSVNAYAWQLRSPDGSSVTSATPFVSAGVQL